jgi:starch synthase
MNILMVSSEAGPYARTGGLGDVLAALPSAVAALGHDVKLILPKYGTIDDRDFGLTPVGKTVSVPVDGTNVSAGIVRSESGADRVDHLFVDCPEYFEREEFYRDPDTGGDYKDNDRRFAFFARAALETALALDWRPDIIHVHDWQAALIPVYLKTSYSSSGFFSESKTVLTIHNLGYQGLFDKKRFRGLNLPDTLMAGMTGAMEFYGKVNFLKAGILMADKITTVSERYAEEIQSGDEFGCGLQGVLKGRSDDLCGILNGVDYSTWLPSKDQYIPHKFGVANLAGKHACRVALLNEAKLPVRERVPLIGMITRLTHQKGIDLVFEAAETLFSLDLQMIVLGTGDDASHKEFRRLERAYPDRLKVYLEFNDRLAHWIEAGSDIFLMPSRYEPCGLNQMYALNYGTVPVVRAVGGLADTVTDYDPKTGTGTGFVFHDYTAEAMLEALTQAIALYGNKQPWTRLMKAGMARDFSWDVSARKYAELFQTLSPR